MKNGKRSTELGAPGMDGTQSETVHWTWKRVAGRFGVSPRHTRRVAKRLGLRPMDLGYRTKRFRLEDIVAAEARQAGE